MRLAGDSSEAIAGGARFDDVRVEGHPVPTLAATRRGSEMTQPTH
jgi:hypothetical protein